MGGCLIGRCFFVRAFLPVASLLMPRQQIVRSRETLKELADIRIGLRIRLGDGVVHIPALLPPRIEHDFFVGVVRMERRHPSLNMVVEEYWSDTGISHHRFAFITMR